MKSDDAQAPEIKTLSTMEKVFGPLVVTPSSETLRFWGLKQDWEINEENEECDDDIDS